MPAINHTFDLDENERLVVRYQQSVPISRVWSPLRHYEEIVLFRQYLRGNTILDVGCGYGEHAGQFNQLGLSYHGIDVSPDVITEARRRCPQNDFRVTSFRNTRLIGRSVSGLWCAHCFINTPQQAMPEVLCELHRILDAEGVLAIIMPTKRQSNGQFMEINELRNWGTENPNQVLWHWTPTPASLVGLCENAGFDALCLEHHEDDQGHYLFQVFTKRRD